MDLLYRYRDSIASPTVRQGVATGELDTKLGALFDYGLRNNVVNGTDLKTFNDSIGFTHNEGEMDPAMVKAVREGGVSWAELEKILPKRSPPAIHNNTTVQLDK